MLHVGQMLATTQLTCSHSATTAPSGTLMTTYAFSKELSHAASFFASMQSLSTPRPSTRWSPTCSRFAAAEPVEQLIHFKNNLIDR